MLPDFCLSAFAFLAARACLGALPLMTLTGPSEAALGLPEAVSALLATALALLWVESASGLWDAGPADELDDWE